MKNPEHPGAIVPRRVPEAFGPPGHRSGKRLGVGRQTLSGLVNEKASVSIEMAYRLSKAFGSAPETWLGMQMAYELANSQGLEQRIQLKRINVA